MRGSIKKRGKGSWRIVVDLPRGPDGKRRQQSVTVRGPKREAEAKLATMLADIENGGFVEPSKLTVADFLERWLDHVATKTATKTHERYTEIVKLGICPRLGGIKLSNLSPIHIQDLYSELLARGRVRKPGGLSAQTVLHYHRILASALKMAVKWRLIQHNPIDRAEPPRPKRAEIVVLSETETAELLDEVEGSPLYIPVLLAVTTGLRRGETLALRWSHVDLERQTISVQHSLEKSRSHGLRFKEPKTKRSRRTIAMLPMLTGALKRHRIAQAEANLRLGKPWDEDGLICSRADGSPINPNTLTSAFASFVRGLDIPQVTFQGLRHTHATHLLANGVHPKVTQERLGHSTIAVTMDLYSHVVPGMQEDAALTVDRALVAALGKRLNAGN